MNDTVPNILARLMDSNAYKVATVMHKNHVEWGVKQFHFNTEEFPNGVYGHRVGSGSDSTVVLDIDEWNVTAWLPDGKQLSIRKDAISRATRDAFEARVRQPAPVGFVDDPNDHLDPSERGMEDWSERPHWDDIEHTEESYQQ